MTAGSLNRLGAVDWPAVESALDAGGFAPLPPVLAPSECDELIALYADDRRFRKRIEMEKFRFGAGEYKYFAAPLPPIVQRLRTELYARLAPVANRWMEALGVQHRYPGSLAAFLDRCHKAGQPRPTPLLLTYGPGGYNCLHQDLYGEVAFPLQVVVMLSPAAAYAGGEFLLVEQRPRAQSRGTALHLEQGAGLVFATRERPVRGTRGWYRTTMRHGVSTVTSGHRMTMGVIFHDAK